MEQDNPDIARNAEVLRITLRLECYKVLGGGGGGGGAKTRANGICAESQVQGNSACCKFNIQ